MQALVAVDGPDRPRRVRRRRPQAPAPARAAGLLDQAGRRPPRARRRRGRPRARARGSPAPSSTPAASLRDAVRRIVVRALFGEELGAEADRFGELLEPGLRYVQKMPQQRFEHDLQVNPYARVQRSNRAADELVLAEVARRRAAGIDEDAHPDTLTALLAGVDGETLTDAELLDQVRSLMAAGFDTTSGGARAGSCSSSAATPRRWPPCGPRSTRSSATGRRPSTTCARLPLTLGAVQEVLRLWPPGPAAPRMSIAPERAARHDDPRRPDGALQRLRHRPAARAVARPRALRPDPLGAGRARAEAVLVRALRRRLPRAASASPSPPSSSR